MDLIDDRFDHGPLSDGTEPGQQPAVFTGSSDEPQDGPVEPAALPVPAPSAELFPVSPESVAPSATVLHFNKAKRMHVQGVPARDLTGSDLQRLVYVQSGLGPEADGYQIVYDDLVSRLTARGIYDKE